MEDDKIAAYMTLYTALVTTAKTAAPLVPFITESIYRNLVCSIDKSAPISVHLTDFPTVNESLIDTALEENMDLLLKMVVLGRAARNEANIKNRQPVANLFVKADKSLDKFFLDIAAEELNVKNVSFKDNMEEYLSYQIKPDFRKLGPKVGKAMGEVKAALLKLNGAEAKKILDTKGELQITTPSGEFTVTADEVEIAVTQTEGYVTESDGKVTVALETKLTTELIEEGFLREVISKLQTMRKDSGFEVTDHITVYVFGNDKISGILKKNEAELRRIVLADDVKYEESANAKVWDINGENVSLATVR
jgi:isoleucyl-tRNA synthetase